MHKLQRLKFAMNLSDLHDNCHELYSIQSLNLYSTLLINRNKQHKNEYFTY